MLMRNLLYICENQKFDHNCQIESSDVAAFFAADSLAADSLAASRGILLRSHVEVEWVDAVCDDVDLVLLRRLAAHLATQLDRECRKVAVNASEESPHCVQGRERGGGYVCGPR